ncbi:hypothetical protein N656DRAFT_510266 [Canariomyces notabilis]|uniref:Uncharacterized protein n=1 Tax=Canariomyces notabilis TaxID=2074819 RepID=A0AAN6QD98_9PEZI|nr:hypothetical protein N656DRAFT_510266 [Canariomyces arenarius]
MTYRIKSLSNNKPLGQKRAWTSVVSLRNVTSQGTRHPPSSLGAWVEPHGEDLLVPVGDSAPALCDSATFLISSVNGMLWSLDDAAGVQGLTMAGPDGGCRCGGHCGSDRRGPASARGSPVRLLALARMDGSNLALESQEFP